MKKYTGIIFAFVILMFSLLLIVLPKSNFSENENRYLEKFPTFSISSLIDGSFMNKLEKYIQDHFPFRNTFVNIQTKSELILGKSEVNNVYITQKGYLIEKNANVDNKTLNRIANMFNVITKTNANTTVMITPTSITINNKLLPKYAIVYSELDQINNIYTKLTNCNTLTLQEELHNLNESGIQAYYMTDHHWTTRAAYEGYVKYMKSINMTPRSLSEFNEQIVSDNFYGTTYSKANIYNIPADKITTYTHKTNELEVKYSNDPKTYYSLYNKDYLDKKDKYAMFLNGNQGFITINNKSIDSSKTLLVIKDSYANCFIPFIANDFKTTYVVDPRYYVDSITDIINENNIDEVLILYNIHTLVTDQGIFNIK